MQTVLLESWQLWLTQVGIPVLSRNILRAEPKQCGSAVALNCEYKYSPRSLCVRNVRIQEENL